jgi:CMD domain protein
MINDVIDHLAGITPGSPLDRLRARRPGAREHAQRAFDALFTPDDEGEVTLVERDAIAAFVAGLHRDPEIASFYADRLGELSPGLLTVVESEIDAGATTGPFGVHPGGGPTAEESYEGLRYQARNPADLGVRLTAGFEHAHLLVFRARESNQDSLDALARAGWSTTGIVTLSQLVAFLTFHIRVVAGLRLLREGSAAS